MLREFAQHYVEIGEMLTRYSTGQELVTIPHNEIDAKRHQNLLEGLTVLRDTCVRINLKTGAILVEQARDDFSDHAPTYFQVAVRGQELSRAFRAELRNCTLLLVPQHRAGYFIDHFGYPLHEENYHFGAEVCSKFPSAVYELVEANNCYALGRSTACVFHLMRALEIGLGSLCRVFSVPFEHTNWHPAIEAVEKKIRDMGTEPGWKAQMDWKNQQEFYSQAASSLMTFKNAWRNYTAHARGKYDENEAAGMLFNMKAFMQKIALKLSE